MSSERIRLLESVDFIWKAPRGARRKHYNGNIPLNERVNGKQHASNEHPHTAVNTTCSDGEAEDDELDYQGAAVPGNDEQAALVISAGPQGTTAQNSQPSRSSNSLPFPPLVTSSGGQQGKYTRCTPQKRGRCSLAPYWCYVIAHTSILPH